MNQTDGVSPRQLTAAAFVAVLSPLIRRFPRVTVDTAGRTAWLSVLMTVLPLALVLLVLWRVYRRRPLGTGFADILCLFLGRWPGRILTGLYGLWLLFYAGFLLRSGAERFITTVYPGAGPAVFVIIMTLLCLPAVLGRLCPIARAAMLFRPLMVILFLLVFFLTMRDIDPALLLPVTADDLQPNAIAALQTVNVLSSAAFLVFFSDHLTRRYTRRDGALAWIGVMLVILLLMTVSCLGVFGPGLTAELSFPFFMLVRDFSALGTLERAEPVVLALWVLSDFVMISLLLHAAGKTLRFCFGCTASDPPRRTLDLRGGRWLLPLGAAVATGLAMALPSDTIAFRHLSDVVIPLAHACFAFALPLLVFGVGLLRRRL